MNKKLIAVAVSSALAVPVIAQAEGEVKVYGRIDQRIDYLSKSPGDSTTDVKGNGSRFGIKYNNDLGNGLSVHGRYEFSIAADRELETNFAQTTITGIGDIRLGTVGVSGAFGRFDVGNQWSAYFNTFGTFVSPTFSLGYYIYSSIGGGPFRASNTLKYSNTFGPVNFQLDARLNGSDEAGAVAEKLSGDGIGAGITFAVGDYVTIGLAADYEDGPDSSSIIGPAVTTARTGLTAALEERAEAQALLNAIANSPLGAITTSMNNIDDAMDIIDDTTSTAERVTAARTTIINERENIVDNTEGGDVPTVRGRIRVQEGLIADATTRRTAAIAAMNTANVATEDANIRAAQMEIATQEGNLVTARAETVGTTHRLNAQRYIDSLDDQETAARKVVYAADAARTDDTTRYGIAVKVQLGELPVSVTGGWQNLDVEKAGVDENGVDAVDNDVDNWFLWFAGDFNENTKWLLGYSNSDGDAASKDADQFTWGVYHTIGGGLKVYYEGTSLDRDTGTDIDRHNLGIRVDF